MKLTRVLLFAAAGITAGLLLTQTEKGKELRKDLADRAGDWGKKLRKFRDESEDYLDDVVDHTKNVARKAKRKVDNELA